MTDAAPIEEFNQCHAGIVRQLTKMGELPNYLEAATLARKTAENACDFFREAVFEHHLDEERELFPVVLQAANSDEIEAVRAMVTRLVNEHRELESMWKMLEPDMKRVAKGQDSNIDVALLSRLVTQYKAHADFEEREFLPLSKTILGRDSEKMASLGYSLHARHQPQPVQTFF